MKRITAIILSLIMCLSLAFFAGAEEALLNPPARRSLLSIQKECRYIELSADARFNEYFIEEMSFPEEPQ